MAVGVFCNVGELDGTDATCPTVYVRGESCSGVEGNDGGDSSSWELRLFNDEPYFEWNSQTDAYNEFRAKFTVNRVLATCRRATAHVAGTPTELDIVIDDFRIMPSERDRFTLQPTILPAATLPTFVPSSSPTKGSNRDSAVVGPSNFTICPEVEFAGDSTPANVTIPSGIHTLAVALVGSLCTLTKVTKTGEFESIARSYDGHAWEVGNAASSSSFSSFAWSCPEGICTAFVLPELTDPSRESYILTSFVRSLSDDDRHARFLEAVTFGTTKTDIHWLRHSAPANWIATQIEIAPTSHREFFRRRANPRQNRPVPAGMPDSACSPASTWRRFALIDTDLSKTVSFQDMGWELQPGPYLLTVDNTPRTLITVLPWLEDGSRVHTHQEYTVCQRPEAILGGEWKLLSDNACLGVMEGNPAVDFGGRPQSADHVLPPLSDTWLVETGPGVFVVADEGGLYNSLPAECEAIVDAPSVFARREDGSWLVHDPRLILEANTQARPLADGGGLNEALTDGTVKCANVARSFANADTCALSDAPSACGSTYVSGRIELDDASIKQLHALTGRFVYTILGLPVVDLLGESIASPCTDGAESRWEIQANTECSPAATDLGANTIAILSHLLSTSLDNNPYLRDIVFPRGANCDAADQLHSDMEIQIGSTCFAHRHPDWRSVYDMTYWTLNHPGGSYHITKWADEWDLSHIIFPDWHTVERWETNHVHFGRIGRYGDHVYYRDLPEELLSDNVAAYFGASGDVEGAGVVVCGSRDEVENDPFWGDVFTPLSSSDEITDADLLEHKEQKGTIWTTVAVTAPDQLRQRVAWAVSQVCTIPTRTNNPLKRLWRSLICTYLSDCTLACFFFVVPVPSAVGFIFLLSPASLYCRWVHPPRFLWSCRIVSKPATKPR